MGTSTSSRGPGSKSPLVPPWADTDGLGPGSIPAERRFQAFRIRLGRFVSGGYQRDLRAALGHYARTATGGSASGSRRFNAMAHSGGTLFDTLSALRDGGDARDASGVDLSSLQGRDTDYVIERIANALTPVGGDADRIRVAITEALSECLDEVEEFDFTSMDTDTLVDVVLAYTSNCIFEQIILDSRDAFKRAREVGRVEQAEEALRELVKAVTAVHMAPLLASDVRSMSGRDVESAQLRATVAIWSEWEEYEA